METIMNNQVNEKLEIAKACDLVLSVLSNKGSGETIEYAISRDQRYISYTQTIEELLVTKGLIEVHTPNYPNSLYSVSSKGRYFMSETSFLRKYQEDDRRERKEIADLELAEKAVADYRKTKLQATISLWVAIGSAIISVLALILNK